MPDMTCQDMQPLMHGYLDGELDLVRNLEMERHLETCPACARIVANHRAVQGALRSGTFYFKAPDALETRLRSSLERGSRTFPILRPGLRGCAKGSSIPVTFVLALQ